ncbi:MAG TPA: SRPBCC domain-containing protein [Burkholderiaceae bacterium]
MLKLNFDILIHASPAIVWNTLFEAATYEQWTAAFCAGSRFEGSWEQGSEMRFLAPDGRGLQAQIEESRREAHLAIQHRAEIDASGQLREMEPAYECYDLRDELGSTRLEVSLDVPPHHESYMRRTWPLALALLKQLCENRTAAAR